MGDEDVGKYEIIEEIGRGGFAVVYKALDTSLDRIVALKVLKPHYLDEPDFVARFQQEARSAAKLFHPHIVTIFEVGEVEGSHFIAMRFLGGQPLSVMIKQQGRLQLDQATSIVEQIGSALDDIHSQNLVHRDVKPSNIIVSNDGQATLTDFGIVRAADGTRYTTTGASMGTPEYMSPEQGQGLETTHHSDIYSLGVVLYEILAGKPPFEAPTPLAVMVKHLQEPPPPLGTLNPNLPASIEAIIAKALAKDPQARYKNPSDLVQDLKDAALAEKPSVAAQMAKLVVPNLDDIDPYGEMILIPAGEFIMGEGSQQRTVYVEEFHIAKYPVTNARYAAFMEAGGYENPEYWSGEGWKWQEESNTTQPEYWHVGDLIQPHHPVVGVTCHEAEAYCRWAGLRLPTEQEWEKAARGTDGRAYPWGDEWQEGRCNSQETFNGCTTPVNKYQDGASPYGVMDMVGNVWEWTSGWYDSKRTYRPLRGGSWLSYQEDMLCAFRNGNRPHYRGNVVGFRCAGNPT
jgi:formylglycine-generating enzyme required for sulfatase activity/tRNA A-37 threonylcarbamoyl transferase component Bud32